MAMGSFYRYCCNCFEAFFIVTTSSCPALETCRRGPIPGVITSVLPTLLLLFFFEVLVPLLISLLNSLRLYISSRSTRMIHSSLVSFSLGRLDEKCIMIGQGNPEAPVPVDSVGSPTPFGHPSDPKTTSSLSVISHNASTSKINVKSAFSSRFSTRPTRQVVADAVVLDV